MGRSVPLVLSKDLEGHSCPGVCLSQEPEGHLETGNRVIFSALSLHPVSKRGVENCVPGGCVPASPQVTFLGPEGEFPFHGGRGLVDPDAGVCLSLLWLRMSVIYRHPFPWLQTTRLELEVTVARKGWLCLHWGSQLPHAPEESGGDSTVGWEAGGLGTTQYCHSKLGFQPRNPGTYPTPAGGQTGMGGTD